ncbi:hypothetical protein [Membranihabitans maritimus]|uniref:hypothetical protein n=1 Tax=Membranihabitans maritimus TaxID=2904244 RepID=UPI001F3DFF9F|nr:hypothetical protein [Membranihabitans maritimus]
MEKCTQSSRKVIRRHILEVLSKKGKEMENNTFSFSQQSIEIITTSDPMLAPKNDFYSQKKGYK